MNVGALKVIIQKGAEHAIGYSDAVQGLTSAAKRRGRELALFRVTGAELEGLDIAGETVLALGFNKSWTEKAIFRLAGAGCHIITIGNNNSFGMSQSVSTVSTDRADGIRCAIEYLTGTGREKIALVGVNMLSVSDRQREVEFISRRGKSDIFYNTLNAAECCARFIASADLYDSVICTNDVIGILLLRAARERGIAVPDELSVMSCGGLSVSQYTDPPMTTVTLEYFRAAENALTAALLRDSFGGDVSVNLLLPSRIIERRSTLRGKPAAAAPDVTFAGGGEDVMIFATDADVIGVGRLNELIAGCDNTDLKIIRMLADGGSINSISRGLPMSMTGLRYRLGKILSRPGLESRAELCETLLRYGIFRGTE